MAEHQGGAARVDRLDGHDVDVSSGHGATPHLEEYVVRLLDECRDEVKLADSKTSMLFAAVATVIAFMVSILLDAESELRTSGDAVILLSILALGAFLVALVLLALAVTPRLGRPEPGKARYFQEHAEFTDPASLLRVLERDTHERVDRHAQQLHVLARIVRRKYQHLRRAMQAISVAMVILALVGLAGVLR
jgi:hypothetical protein